MTKTNSSGASSSTSSGAVPDLKALGDEGVSGAFVPYCGGRSVPWIKGHAVGKFHEYLRNGMS